MFSLNRRVVLLCANRALILKWLPSARAVELGELKVSACTVHKRTKKDTSISLLVTPVPVKPSEDDSNAGFELSGHVDKFKIVRVINTFYRKNELKLLAEEHNLDEYLLQKGFASFRKFCLETPSLPTDLHIVFSDILKGHGNHLDIFPYFLRHVKEMFPHLDCIEDLKKIGDLRNPAQWYQEARNMKRKIYFHCGPTNSGKTYHAIQSFLTAKSGVYCGPLKLLAVEVFNKANKEGTPCDLVTGEEIICVTPEKTTSHVACTVEMCSMEKAYDVAIIDEIQMIKDSARGWAWTRALLGLKAREIHVCGEEAAVDIVDSILCTTNEMLEVKKYERLTELKIDASVEDFNNIRPGDCIVCFNKNDIYSVTQALEKRRMEVAVIYGSLPPGTKLTQCSKFNDPEDPCKVLVATDAIGMGLNLSIKRVIFYSIIKPSFNDKGEMEVVPISVSQALQIAGRAGRYGSAYSEGLVTTFKSSDLPILKELLSKKPECVMSAGLLPTIDQIELYSYYLPNSTLSNLMDIFVNLSTVDDSIYFMCDMRDFKYLAEMIEHVQLPLRVKYTFCCAPINRKLQFACSMFLRFAKMYSENEAISLQILCKHIEWPPKPPKTVRHLSDMEATHDVLDLYLWLGYRFPEYFPDADSVKKLQKELDFLIQEGVANMRKLLKNSEGEVGDSECQKKPTSVKETKKPRFLKDLLRNINLEDIDDKVQTAKGK